jgi:N-sulfoglucosamine sulfohydrolase
MNHTTPPNIVYLHSHDTGRYLQPYGHPVRTPHLQRLAEHSAVFRNAFAAAPTCSPSRAALLTGETPHQAGMLGLAHRGFRLAHPERHLATILRDTGYDTILTGMQHVCEDDQSTVGYTHDLRPPRLNVADVAPVAVDAIWRHAGSGRPFFLDVGFEETHRPFPDTPDDAGNWLRPPALIPDAPETRRDMAGYHASAEELDRGVGMVLDALDASGIARNTIVVATTDHGLAFPGMKGTLTDHGLGVFLIISAPFDGFHDGTVVDAMVSHLDVFPTLCDLTGIAPPAWLQGSSLQPLVRGDVVELHDALFGEVSFHATYEPQRTVRTPRWRYVRRFDDRDTVTLANVDDGLSRDYMLAYNWDHERVEREALYDVVLDPMQGNNVVDEPALATTRSRLRENLEEWMRVTRDPLLDGPIPLPEGARMNRLDARSADEDLVDSETYRGAGS